ncbi:hypothetical protein [Snuella lapsa]
MILNRVIQNALCFLLIMASLNVVAQKPVNELKWNIGVSDN